MTITVTLDLPSNLVKPDEHHELSAFIHIYRLGLLRKSQGLAEVVHRGLREPLI